MRRTSILLLVVGCADHPQPAPDPEPDPEPGETGRVTPLLCTAGVPGDPNCPLNEVPLDELGSTGSIRFTAQTLGSGLYLTGVTFLAGAEGLYFEHPVILVWRGEATEPMIVDPYIDLIVNLEPNTTESLDQAAAVLGAATDRLSFRFDVVGPYRP